MRDEGLKPDKTPVIAGEWGYSTWERGNDEQTQAANRKPRNRIARARLV